MKKVVVLTGAGISAESGISTFRDAGGLWEGHDVMEVASIEGWNKNPQLVLDFYNKRRQVAANAQPNAGHQALVALEEYFDVVVITQNVDDLHERAGSSRVIHLHGELSKGRSSVDEELIVPLEDKDIGWGDLCPKGSQLRPHIVWFGEMVPMMEVAVDEVAGADIFLIVGTSLLVYPAAGLLNYVKSEAPLFVVDPERPSVYFDSGVTFFEENASIGIPKLANILIEQYL